MTRKNVKEYLKYLSYKGISTNNFTFSLSLTFGFYLQPSTMFIKCFLSGFAYCFYMNKLFAILRKKKSGCWIQGTFFGILGYSDDSLLLAPSLDALQEMINICETYANSHNLRFSTDPDPRKCKTKCLAFLQKARPLPPMYLCGNPLPWVSTGKHLGMTLTDKIDGMKADILIKRAEYINKNNEILQEFYFSHPKSKIKSTQFTIHTLVDPACGTSSVRKPAWSRTPGKSP